MIPTISETGALPGVSVEQLADVLVRVQDHPTGAIDELLPGAWALARDGA
ncbi:MAG: hypothetical protein ACRENE_27730 [Polyangiaceae bacterium]